jgi:predicted RNase H-like nuclease
VFTAPTRAATRVDSYEEGSAINASLTGKKLSKQAWGIVPKIAEVDAYLLAADSSERAAVREVHPEVLFWALSGRTSMRYRKSAAEGIEERLEVLERFAPCVREAYTECLDSWPRSQVARDDVLDAFAAAVTGHLGGEHLSTLPATPEHDGHGLAMEMVYWLAGDGTRGLPSLIASGCGPPDGPSETYNAAGGLTWKTDEEKLVCCSFC